MAEYDEIKKHPPKGRRWKAVAIGQSVGILLGAGLVHVVKNGEVETGDSQTHNSEGNKNSLDVATVNDSLSFESARAQAQATMGDNAVFTWRGGTYATCDEQQWDEKPAQEQERIAEAIETEFTVEQLESDPLLNMEEDGFLRVTDGDGRDYLYVNNERLVVSDGDDVDIVSTDYSDDDVVAVAPGFSLDNSHVIHTVDEVTVIDDDDAESDVENGEVLDMETGEYYSQPVAEVIDDDDSQDDFEMDEDGEDAVMDSEAISDMVQVDAAMDADASPDIIQEDVAIDADASPDLILEDAAPVYEMTPDIIQEDVPEDMLNEDNQVQDDVFFDDGAMSGPEDFDQ
jgi:hypothetical protein